MLRRDEDVPQDRPLSRLVGLAQHNLKDLACLTTQHPVHSRCRTGAAQLHTKRHIRIVGQAREQAVHGAFHPFDMSTSKSRPRMVCFGTFYFQMCFAPQRRAVCNSQKWLGPDVLIVEHSFSRRSSNIAWNVESLVKISKKNWAVDKPTEMP